MNENSFIELVRRGDVMPEEIGIFAQQWRRQGRKGPLHEFLGMTEAQLEAYRLDPTTIGQIVAQSRPK